MASMWSEVPEDLLRLIANRLDTLTDQVRFACVCTSWKSILLSIRPSHSWCLLYRFEEEPSELGEKFLFLPERKIHHLEFIPEVLGRSKFRGCSFSWLVCTDDFSPKISLYNPFTKVLIALPPRYNFPDVIRYCPPERSHPVYEIEIYDVDDDDTEIDFVATSSVHIYLIHKFVLSSSPSKPNCMVVAIYGTMDYNLAYCKIGDEKWTSIAKGRMRYDDIIFRDKNLLYAVTITSHVHVFDLSSNSPKLVDTIQPPPPQPLPPPPPEELGQPEPGRRSYLVNTSIGLLLVQRHWLWTGSLYEGNQCEKTKIFNLYMYEPSSRSWRRVENMDENVLFLGLNTGVSIPSSRVGGYKGNHIYFTDTLLVFSLRTARHGPYEIGVYDLDSKSAQCLQRYDTKKYWIRPTPIWYIHSPEDFFERDL